MEIVRILETLSRRRAWVPLAALVAVAVGVMVAYEVSVSPPGLKSKSFEVGAASTEMLFDSPQSSLVRLDKDLGPTASRAQIFATFMRSGTFTAEIARTAGVPPALLTTAGPFAPNEANSEEDGETRATQLLAEESPYRLRFSAGSSDSPLPVLTIFARAPSAEAAIRLADSAAKVLKSYVGRAAAANAPPLDRLVVEQLTPSEGGLIAENVATKSVLLTGLAVFAGLLVLIVLVSGVLDNYKVEQMRRRLDGPLSEPPEPFGAGHEQIGNGSAADPLRTRAGS